MALGGRKGRLAKAAGAEPAGQMRDEKLHASVARSTFRSQNVQSTPGSGLLEVELSKKCTPLWREARFEVKMYKAQQVRTTFIHFWKLSCRKSARRCGAKHISKSKCTKHTSSGPLLEVAMSKKCTPLWREDARSTFQSQNVKSIRGSDHFWTFRCDFAWQAQGIVDRAKSEQNVRVL